MPINFYESIVGMFDRSYLKHKDFEPEPDEEEDSPDD
jgi:hypothetical protein|tara:strand:+ start:4756 stop:4866 length:111 start_codon:yes stop_codon:yes gene_type:complete